MISIETARLARRDSRRLRLDSNALRLATRRQRPTLHARPAGAEAVSRSARARRAAPLPSPWSELSWVTVDPSLDRILVPLD